MVAIQLCWLFTLNQKKKKKNSIDENNLNISHAGFFISPNLFHFKQKGVLTLPIEFQRESTVRRSCRTRLLKSSLPGREILHYVAYIQRQSKQIDCMNIYQRVICISNKCVVHSRLATRFIKRIKFFSSTGGTLLQNRS